MAAESIYAKRKYGFPLIKPSEKGTTTSIEYVDVTATLVSAKPDIGDTWGDYLGAVTSSYIEELENTGKSTLFVDVTYEFQAGENVTLGDNNYIGAYCIIGDPAEHKKYWGKQKGNVIIGDNNIITGLVTIDAGTEDIREVSVLIKNFKKTDFTTELAEKGKLIKQKKDWR